MQFLSAADFGDRQAAAELLPLVYDELQKLAAALISKLGDDEFDTRVEAEAELDKLGVTAREEILAAMKSPVPEVAYRASRLASRLKLAASDTPMSVVLAARAVRVLVRAATPDAKKLLAEMAAGDFGPDNVAAAKAALMRK